MNMLVAVAAGGAMGAAARYLVSGWLGKLLGTVFPYATLAVNVSGCFAMGALVAAAALRWNLGPEMRAFLTVGVLGGFTTFSAFSMEVVLLMERGEALWAGLYVALSVGLCIAALMCGMHLARGALA